MGQAALVCTQDQAHSGPTLAALEAGYDVLLEKPMATTAGECVELVKAAERTGRQLHVCHVLRYTSHFGKIREILASGVLGEVVTVDHRENVSWWHMAHSFVRGNWRNRSQSSPMILAKCCHDFDILLWLLHRECVALTSFGGLSHFVPEKAPPGAPAHCMEGCPASDTCPYYAPFVYEDLLPLWRDVREGSSGTVRLVAGAQIRWPGLVRTLAPVLSPLREVSDYRGWPRSVVVQDPSPAKLRTALEGAYGRCVYHCDNDVVDHQVVSMEFAGGMTVTLTMQGHSHREGRTTRIQGSRAELQAWFGIGDSWVTISDHRTGCTRRVDTSAAVQDGHGGGDDRLMDSFCTSLRDPSASALTSAASSLESHLMAFAADQARREQCLVRMDAFRRQVGAGARSPW
jgi:predicted dehydrogenase